MVLPRLNLFVPAGACGFGFPVQHPKTSGLELLHQTSLMPGRAFWVSIVHGHQQGSEPVFYPHAQHQTVFLGVYNTLC